MQYMPWELAMEWSITPARSAYQVTSMTRDRSSIALLGERALQSTWQFKLWPIMPLLCWGRHSLPRVSRRSNTSQKWRRWMEFSSSLCRLYPVLYMRRGW
jgi:hypothetical protein